MANILDLPEKEDFKYDPNNLMDTLIKQLGIKNDAALSRRLEVAPPLISKIRHKMLPVGPNLIIRMHEESGLSIKELRALMGIGGRNLRRQILKSHCITMPVNFG